MTIPILRKFNLQDHVDRVGVDAFDLAKARALMRLKLEADALRGATRLREALAEEMAIIATGGPRRTFSQKRFGRAEQATQDIIDHYLNTTEPAC